MRQHSSLAEAQTDIPSYFVIWCLRLCFEQIITIVYRDMFEFWLMPLLLEQRSDTVFEQHSAFPYSITAITFLASSCQIVKLAEKDEAFLCHHVHHIQPSSTILCKGLYCQCKTTGRIRINTETRLLYEF